MAHDIIYGINPLEVELTPYLEDKTISIYERLEIAFARVNTALLESDSKEGLEALQFISEHFVVVPIPPGLSRASFHKIITARSIDLLDREAEACAQIAEGYLLENELGANLRSIKGARNEFIKIIAGTIRARKGKIR